MSADLAIPAFSGTKDRERVYLEVRVNRGRRWYAACNGYVCSIAEPRSLDVIEAAVRKVARRAFVNYWDDTPPSGVKEKVRVESEVRGFEYLASTEKLEVIHVR